MRQFGWTGPWPYGVAFLEYLQWREGAGAMIHVVGHIFSYPPTVSSSCYSPRERHWTPQLAASASNCTFNFLFLAHEICGRYIIVIMIFIWLRTPTKVSTYSDNRNSNDDRRSTSLLSYDAFDRASPGRLRQQAIWKCSWAFEPSCFSRRQIERSKFWLPDIFLLFSCMQRLSMITSSISWIKWESSKGDYRLPPTFLRLPLPSPMSSVTLTAPVQALYELIYLSMIAFIVSEDDVSKYISSELL